MLSAAFYGDAELLHLLNLQRLLRFHAERIIERPGRFWRMQMSRIASIVFVMSSFAAGGAVLAASTPSYLTPDTLSWVAGKGASKGSSSAVLAGDPNKAGFAMVRVRMPDGYSNPPHYHAHPEYITVLQGTLLFGTGDKIDKSEARVLTAGSFIRVPAGLHHWSMAQGETIEEVAGEGPQTNIPVKSGAM